MFQQLWRRIINGFFSCWGRRGVGCVWSNRSDRGGFGVVLGDVSHGAIWKREIWNWISEKLFVFLWEGKVIISQDYRRKDIFSSIACENIILSKCLSELLFVCLTWN